MSVKVAVGTHFSRRFRNIIDRCRLCNEDFTILSNNCMAGKIYHDLGLKFLTPTINTYIKPDHFIKFLADIKYYLNQTITPVVGNYEYPVGRILDVFLYFKHYTSFEEAVDKWNERKARINWENIYVMMTDRYLELEKEHFTPKSCSDDVFKQLELLPYEHKICFTAKKHQEECCYQLKEFSKDNCVGVITDIVDIWGSRMYQLSRFDYVKWLSNERIRQENS